MANELTKVTDQNGVDHPFKDVAAFPRSEQAVLGAYNILPTGNVSHNDHGIVVSTDSVGIVTVTGTLASDAPVIYKTYIANYKLPVGRYKMVGCPPNGANNLQNQLLEVKNGSTVVNSYTDIGEGVEFEITDPSHTISVYIPRLGNGLRGQACNFVYKPMITTDLNATYADFVPFAMTNKELTPHARISDFTYSENVQVADTGQAEITSFGGSMVDINMLVKGLVANSGAWATVGTIPADIRPKGYRIGNAYKNNASDVFNCSVDATGVVRVRNMNNAIVATDVICISAIYSTL